MRRIPELECLYIDFDSFFASVEQQLQPELRGRPVGVVPTMSRHTCCIAASYEAKAFGVKTGTSVEEAKKLCPDIAFTPARHDVYVVVHKAIKAEVHRHVPVDKAWSIDEVSCTLMGRERRAPEALAARIKAGLREAIGPAVTPSIGFGANSLLAKIAAEMDKPDGLVILHPEDAPGRLLELELTDIPGIAKGVAGRLARAGVHDMAALWDLAPKQARAIWGTVEGERFWHMLHGYDVSPGETERRMFGHSRVLPADWRDPDKAFECARLLTIKAARRLRRDGFEGTRFSLGVRLPDSARWSGEGAFAPASDDRAFILALRRLWTDFLQDAKREGGVPPIKGVSIFIHGLADRSARQFDLFEARLTATETARAAKWRRASEALDGLARKYGAKAASFGPWLEPPGGYAGAKIAFGRVPDFADFDDGLPDKAGLLPPQPADEARELAYEACAEG